jgi:chemotaxis protein methyltransferase CheR
MTLHSLGGGDQDLRILATDISTAVLERAITGVYTPKSVSEIPPHLLARYFKCERAANQTHYTVGDELRRLTTFRHLNLTHLPFQLRGPLDLIMCRNVMIYFDQDLRSRLVCEFARLLKPGGCLIISHSESLVGIEHELKMVRPSLYIKPSGSGHPS